MMKGKDDEVAELGDSGFGSFDGGEVPLSVYESDAGEAGESEAGEVLELHADPTISVSLEADGSFTLDKKLPVFPVEHYPAWLRSMVTWTAESLQAPVCLPAVFSLGILAAAASNRVKVVGPNSWEQQCNLYVAVALPPGASKSPVVSRLLRPVLAVEEELASRSRADIVRKQAEADVVAKRLQMAKDAAAKSKDDAELVQALCEVRARADELAAVEVPAVRRLLADDATPEALASLLAQQQGRMAILSDEGGIFDLMQGRYSTKSNIEIFLKAHAGDGVSRTDRMDRSTAVRDPALTMALAVQPIVLSNIGADEQLAGRGLLARFLCAVPATNIGYRNIADAPATPEEVVADYNRHIGRLFDLMERTDEAKLPLSAGALERFKEYQRECEVRLRFGQPLYADRSWGMKLTGHVLRIAGLLHVAHEMAVTGEISAATMDAACQIGDYFVAHQLAVVSVMSERPADRIAEMIKQWVVSTGTEVFSQRDLHRALQSRQVREAADLFQPLTLLMERGWLRKEPDEESSGKGRKRSPRFRAHPKLLSKPSTAIAAAPTW